MDASSYDGDSLEFLEAVNVIDELAFDVDELNKDLDFVSGPDMLGMIGAFGETGSYAPACALESIWILREKLDEVQKSMKKAMEGCQQLIRLIDDGGEPRLDVVQIVQNGTYGIREKIKELIEEHINCLYDCKIISRPCHLSVSAILDQLRENPELLDDDGHLDYDTFCSILAKNERLKRWFFGEITSVIMNEFDGFEAVE